MSKRREKDIFPFGHQDGDVKPEQKQELVKHKMSAVTLYTDRAGCWQHSDIVLIAMFKPQPNILEKKNLNRCLLSSSKRQKKNRDKLLISYHLFIMKYINLKRTTIAHKHVSLWSVL